MKPSEIKKALAKVNVSIASLTSQRDNLLAKLNPIENVKPLQWVIRYNVYYQFIRKDERNVVLHRKGKEHCVSLSNFDDQFTLANEAEVAQHLRHLASRSESYLADGSMNHDDSMKHEFYMITVRGLKGATVRHDNYAKAEKEAIRLSTVENHEAYIMGVVAKVKPVMTHEIIKS